MLRNLGKQMKYLMSTKHLCNRLFILSQSFFFNHDFSILAKWFTPLLCLNKLKLCFSSRNRKLFYSQPVVCELFSYYWPTFKWAQTEFFKSKRNITILKQQKWWDCCHCPCALVTHIRILKHNYYYHNQVIAPKLWGLWMLYKCWTTYFIVT